MFLEESHYYIHMLADEFCEIYDNEIGCMDPCDEEVIEHIEDYYDRHYGSLLQRGIWSAYNPQYDGPEYLHPEFDDY